MSVTGEPDRPPVKAGVPLTDLGAGLFALSAILAALHWRTVVRARTAHRHVAARSRPRACRCGRRPSSSPAGRRNALGSAHRMSAPYQAFRCRDGYITIGAANDRTFGKLAALLGHRGVDQPTRASRPTRAASNIARSSRRLIEAVTGDATPCRTGCSAWTRRASRADQSTRTREVFADPQVIGARDGGRASTIRRSGR